jgi:hypothetical protein
MAIYLETHITIEPVFEENLELLKKLVQPFGFKVASLLLQKRANDTPELSKYDTFMTAHNSVEDYDLACNNIKQVVVLLNDSGYKVYRYKIESVVIDSRNKDIFNLLSI